MPTGDVLREDKGGNEYEKEEPCSEADSAVGTAGCFQCSGVLLR